MTALFAEEKSAFLPLPLEPFRYYQYGQRTVHLDGFVEVEAAYCGAPPGWIGRLVNVQWNELYVRLLGPRTGQLLREHVRHKRGGYRINPEDSPKRTPLGTLQLLARAERAGAQIGAFCQAIHRRQGELGVRRNCRNSSGRIMLNSVRSGVVAISGSRLGRFLRGGWASQRAVGSSISPARSSPSRSPRQTMSRSAPFACLHPHARFLTEPDRDLVQHPDATGAARGELRQCR